MAWTKITAVSDRIYIDGTDVSNGFQTFGLTSAHSEEEAGAFNAAGVTETVPGATDQGFSGTFHNTEEMFNFLWPLHASRSVVEIQWQPNGLVDSNAPVFYGNCTINEFSPVDTFGQVSTSPFSASIADENGITMATGT